MSNKDDTIRPVRNAVENTIQKIPKGPLGFVGDGGLAGATGFAIAEITHAIIPGSETDPGVSIESQNVLRKNGVEIHNFKILAYSENVARFAARFRAAPSNADFFIREVKVESSEPELQRRTVTLWDIKVKVEDRKMAEKNKNDDKDLSSMV